MEMEEITAPAIQVTLVPYLEIEIMKFSHLARFLIQPVNNGGREGRGEHGDSIENTSYREQR